MLVHEVTLPSGKKVYVRIGGLGEYMRQYGFVYSYFGDNNVHHMKDENGNIYQSRTTEINGIRKLYQLTKGL